VFERFTDRARAVVMHAQEEARLLNHNYIGTEHLLAGLLIDPEGMGAKALADCGITVEIVRREIERRIGRGSEEPKGHIPFTPRAKKVLELALRQALRLQHNYIGTEHVLLGLLAEGEGVAAQILTSEVDGGLVRVREATFGVLDMPAQALVGIEGRLAEIGRSVRERFPRFGFTLGTHEDETRKRLEAVEARLSAIEGLLRKLAGEAGEEEVS
jgi:ATP-dependent Clp protease ATP-binding subunit ClpC